MADFSTWNRATLEQFAQEATDKLVANRAAIAELCDLLEYWIEPRCGCIACDEARAAITKHTTTTTKEQ